jgi:hypothetical protein
MLGEDRDPKPCVERRKNAGGACALQHNGPRPAGAIELFQSKTPPAAVWRIERERRRRRWIELHRPPAGSFVIHPPGTRHSPGSVGGCIALLIYEKAVRFVNSD